MTKKTKKLEEIYDKGKELVEFYRNNPSVAAYELLGVDLAPIQRIVFNDMWFKSYVIVVAGRGYGKSQYTQSLTHFNGKGLVYLNEELPTIPSYLKDGEEEIIDWDDEVYTSEGFRNTKKLCLEKGIDGKFVKTVNGFENRGSNHHPLLVLNEECDFIYKGLDELEIGDRVCIQRSQQVFGKNLIPLDDSYLIGLFIGDGSINVGNPPSITTEDKYVKDFCIKYCEDNSVKYREDKDKRTKNTSSIVFKGFNLFFEKYKVGRVLSYDKSVPYSIRTATKEVQVEFLRGYFDSDGTVHNTNGGVSCCSVSKKLLREVQIMLLNFGIVSRLREKKTKSNFGRAYLLDILSEDAHKFKEYIGFGLERKQKILNDYFSNKKLNVNKDTIPYALDLCYEITKYYHNTYTTSKKPSFRIKTSNKKELTYGRLHRFLCQCRDVESAGFNLIEVKDKINKLKEILKYNYYFDTVASVEDWKGDCYDFEMDMEKSIEPNYFSNGFINHNTFALGLLSALSAMLYPGNRVGLIGPVFRQSKMIFHEVEKLYDQSSILREACVKKPTRGSDTCYLKFKSVGGRTPSYIEALPLGDGCLTNCNYSTFSDRFDTIGSAHNLSVNKNHYIDREEFVWGNGKFRKSDRSLCNGEKKVVKLKTKKGFESAGTPNHRFKVVRNSKIVWARFDEMVVGDRILIDRSYRWHNGNSDVTAQQAYALGLMIGDGSYTNKYKLRYTTIDEELIYNLNKGTDLDFYSVASDNVHYDVFGKKSVSKWLGFWGMDLTYTKDKKLPKKMLSSSRDCMSACISGLYDSDGYVQVSTMKGGTSITIGFTNTSEELINQLQYILLHYGIVATKISRDRNKNWNTVYDLLITGPDVKIFDEEIGFTLKRKNIVLKSAIAVKTKWFSYEDVPQIKELMVDISSNNRVKKGKGCKESRYVKAYTLKNKKYITPYLVNCFLKTYDYLSDERIEVIKDFINPDIYYDEIIEISEDYDITYDIHVPEGNEYCANGFFSHNSKIRGSRFYTIVVDELAQVPDQILDLVLRPMGATSLAPMERVRRLEEQKRLIKAGLATAEDFEEEKVNKMIMASSGYYKFNHMWRRMKDHWKMMAKAEKEGKECQYSVWQVPYWDLPEGFLDLNNIAEAKRIMSMSEYSMEYEAAMISDSEGFFKASLLDECTSGSDFGLKLTPDSNKSYIMGVDPNQGGKASCGVIILEIGRPNKIVNVIELKSSTTQQLTESIQNLCDKYKIVRILMDRGGGGKAVMDLLEEGYNNKEPILDRDNPDNAHREGRHILEMVNFSTTWISDANFTAKAMFEDKSLLFPELSVSASDMVAKAYKSVEVLKSQLLSIVVTQTATGILHFDTPSKNMNKDLYSALILAAYGARALERELEEDGVPILYNSSGMVRPREGGAKNFSILESGGSGFGSSSSSVSRFGLNTAVLQKKK